MAITLSTKFGANFLLPACAAALLVACGGDGGFTSDGSAGSGSTGGSTTTTTSGVTMALSIGIGTGTLSAGGSTSLTVTLTDSAGAPYQSDTSVTFTSTCAGAGTASIESPVTTSNGSANSTYAALGCEGTDTVTATATVEGTSLTTTGSITVAGADVGQIQFVSASPSSIGLRGMGGAGIQEQSVVTFKVVNTTGAPVANEDVTFALSTSVGGITFSPATATSGADGTVQTIVNSGTVQTPLRVLASVTDSGTGITYSTQSDKLTISTGVADQDSFSLSVETFNPNACSINGVSVGVTARVADRFNNPVPDGTVVNFRTEGGSIEPTCETANGACSVNWVSQNPRPTTGAGSESDCVSTITAFAFGEESFLDLNGNGVYDSATESYSDQAEPFEDYNANASRDASTEPFIDFDGDGVFDPANGSYDGVLCNGSGCATSLIYVRDNIRIVMSEGRAAADIDFFAADGVTPISTVAAGNTIYIRVADANGNILPVGSSIAVTGPEGVELSGTTSYSIPNEFSTSGTWLQVAIADADVAVVNGPGLIEVKVTAGGNETPATLSVTGF